MQGKTNTTQTHHYFCRAAVAPAIVVRGDHFELEVVAALVAVHDGSLQQAAERLDHEAVLAVPGLLARRRLDDQVVQHRTVVPRVPV